MFLTRFACLFAFFVSTAFSDIRVQHTHIPSSSVTRDWIRRVKDYPYCGVCKNVVKLVNDVIVTNSTFDIFRKAAIEICVVVVEADHHDGKFMCPGLIDEYGPAVLFIADRIVLDPLKICQDLNFCARKKIHNVPRVFGPQRKRSSRTVRQEEHRLFSATVRQERHRFSGGTVRQGRHRLSTGTKKRLSIVQLTDFHVDEKYAEGSPTECGLYICCRANYNGTGSAGLFGDYNCDVPWKTVKVMTDAINKLEPRPDFVLYTGDFPPHDISQETWTTQLTSDHHGTTFLRQNLPNLTIFPALGNHESFPQSLYYQPHEDFQYLNKQTAVWWQQLFPVPPDQVENIKYSAYYTTLVRPGLRILSFNSDYGYTTNFYGLLNNQISAYFKQMEFMKKTLEDARLKGEKVIIIGHVPPGNFPHVYKEYGAFYRNIATKYAEVIVLQVFGHTHKDHFELVIDPKDINKPTGVVLIAPSVTSEGRGNPSFRVYHLDAETFHLLDYDQYYINLTEANAVRKATVRLSYSALQEYGLNDMSPDAFLDLTDRFKSDDKLFGKYWHNRFARSNQGGDCDIGCRTLIICEARSASVTSFLNCVDSAMSN